MLRLLKGVVLTTGLTAGLLLAGCATEGGLNRGANAVPGSRPGEPTTQAVACDKCQITWVKVPRTPGGGKDYLVTGYGARRSMECPECKGAVENLFATGKLEHTCSACSGTMQTCDAHP